MKLFEYFKDVSDVKIAKKIGGITSETVRAYRVLKNVPNLQNMLKIYELTKGKVKPQDFYEPFINELKNKKKNEKN